MTFANRFINSVDKKSLKLTQVVNTVEVQPGNPPTGDWVSLLFQFLDYISRSLWTSVISSVTWEI